MSANREYIEITKALVTLQGDIISLRRDVLAIKDKIASPLPKKQTKVVNFNAPMGAGGVRERTIEELTEFCKGKSILRLKTETGLSYPTLERIKDGSKGVKIRLKTIEILSRYMYCLEHNVTFDKNA